MRLHRCLRNETISTKPTYIGSLTGVGSHMKNQRRSLRETAPAIRALIRLLTGMYTCVFDHLVLFRKRFTTHFTGIRFIACVDSHVKFEFLLGRDPFTANVTNDRQVYIVVDGHFVSSETESRFVVFFAYITVEFN